MGGKIGAPNPIDVIVGAPISKLPKPGGGGGDDSGSATFSGGGVNLSPLMMAMRGYKPKQADSDYNQDQPDPTASFAEQRRAMAAKPTQPTQEDLAKQIKPGTFGG